jgi:DNA-binding transcriptional MerR regulator
MVTKSATAFRTISEVAGELDLPQHVLRFWETRFNTVRPVKRAGGRRYYRPEDIDLLRKIRNLLYDDGYTIKGVQKLLREGGASGLPTSASAEPPSEDTGPSEAKMTNTKDLQAIISELEDIRGLLDQST